MVSTLVPQCTTVAHPSFPLTRARCKSISRNKCKLVLVSTFSVFIKVHAVGAGCLFASSFRATLVIISDV